MTSVEKELRKILAISNGIRHLYLDDGECSFGGSIDPRIPPFDFLTATPDEIRNFLNLYKQKELLYKKLGYILETGHGDKFSKELPDCLLPEAWKPVYTNVAEIEYLQFMVDRKMKDQNE